MIKYDMPKLVGGSYIGEIASITGLFSTTLGPL